MSVALLVLVLVLVLAALLREAKRSIFLFCFSVLHNEVNSTPTLPDLNTYSARLCVLKAAMHGKKRVHARRHAHQRMFLYMRPLRNQT